MPDTNELKQICHKSLLVLYQAEDLFKNKNVPETYQTVIKETIQNLETLINHINQRNKIWKSKTFKSK